MGAFDRFRSPKPVVITNTTPSGEPWVLELIEGNSPTSKIDERTKKLDNIKEFQKLYLHDSLTFSLVNFLVHKIVPEFIFLGDVETCKKLKEWSSDLGLKHIFEDIIRDIILAGGSWTEPLFSSISLESIKIINPANMDFIRDNDGNVKFDETNKPLGFTQEVSGMRRYWFKDRIVTEDGEIVAKGKEDLRDKLKYFKLISFGDSELGISFIGPIYRSAMIRANLEDMVGESAFRGGGMVAYITGEPPEAVKTNLKKDLTNITSRNVFMLTDKIKLATVPIPEVAQRSDLMYLLADFEASGLGVPLDILLSGGRTYKQDLTAKMVDLEVRISSYQERFAKQVQTFIINPLLQKWNIQNKAYIKFVAVSPVTQMNRARVIATLARRELFTYDPEVEIQIRKELNLPTSIPEKEFKKWKKGRPEVPVEPAPDVVPQKAIQSDQKSEQPTNKE